MPQLALQWSLRSGIRADNSRSGCKSANGFYVPPLRHLASGHPQTIDCPGHADTARQSTGIKQRSDLTVAPRDTPDVTVSDNQRPRHAIACPIATTSRGGSGGSGGAHERVGADASAPGPACARGGCEPGVQHRRLGAEGPGCSDQGGREEAVDWIRADEETESGRSSLSAPSWRPLLVRKRVRTRVSYTFLVLAR